MLQRTSAAIPIAIVRFRSRLILAVGLFHLTNVVVAGSATAWPFMARAQERIRLVGLLNIVAEDDPEPRLRIAAFKKACRNWVGPTAAYELKHAGLAVTLSVFANMQRNWLRSGPDVILTSGSVTVRPLQQATRTIPIVFVQAVDPVGSGYVESMSRPGGNTTGFTQFEYSLSGKWLELLKQIAPQVTRVAVVRDPVNGSGIASSP